MIGAGIVFLTSVIHQLESATIKEYGRRYQKGGMFFNAVICLFATVFFVVSDTDGFNYSGEIIIYGAVNSVMYSGGFYGAYMAYKLGSFGVTGLAISFTSVLSALYGIIVLKESASFITYTALGLIALSLFLTNHKKDKLAEKKRFSFKWLGYILLTVLSNCCVTVIGKIQFDAFGNVYKNEFSVISLLGATVALVVIGLIFERDSFKRTLGKGILYGATAGVLNGIKNLLILISYNFISLSIASAARSALSLVMGFVVSICVYREKFTLRQILGVMIIIAAVVAMSLKI